MAIQNLASRLPYHNNGNRSDNRAENLRWDTKKNNSADKVRHGTAIRGVQMGTAKLDDRSVQFIRAMASVGFLQRQIAEVFGVSQPLIGLILRNKAWSHVPQPKSPVPSPYFF